MLQVSSSHALRSSNHAILVSIAAPPPLRPAAGDGRVPGQALICAGRKTPPQPAGNLTWRMTRPSSFFDLHFFSLSRFPMGGVSGMDHHDPAPAAADRRAAPANRMAGAQKTPCSTVVNAARGRREDRAVVVAFAVTCRRRDRDTMRPRHKPFFSPERATGRARRRAPSHRPTLVHAANLRAIPDRGSKQAACTLAQTTA